VHVQTDGELAREDAAVLEAAIDNNNVSSINWSHVSDTIRQLTSQSKSPYNTPECDPRTCSLTFIPNQQTM
jgi:hypothetical protein